MSGDNIPAVVLAAGEGRRLDPLTNRRPKPMVPVANQPILEYVVSAIADAGIDRIVLVVGYQEERIRNHFGDGNEWGIEIEYVVQEKQLGTAHAILQVESAVTGPFLVMNGDRLVDASLVDQVRHEIRQNDEIVLAVTQAKQASNYGVVSLDSDRVVAISEKPREPVSSELINAGVYGFDDSIFEAIQATPAERGELAITTTLDQLAGNRSIRAIRYHGLWLDVSNLWDLLAVNAAVINRTDQNNTSVDSNTARDTVIGSDVTLGRNATVGGGTAVGDNVTIESNAVLSNTVVFSDVIIEAGAVVRDAIIAGNARIGANATIAGGSTRMIVEDTIHDDVELGGVVGDNATLGSGVTINPGTVVGDGATVDHGVSLRGRIDSDAIVRRG